MNWRRTSGTSGTNRTNWTNWMDRMNGTSGTSGTSVYGAGPMLDFGKSISSCDHPRLFMN